MSAQRVPVITFELPAVAASVAAARHRLLAFAQEHSRDLDLHQRVALAITEAFTNAVVHAYHDLDAGDRELCVSADIDDHALECVIVDRGHGFQADSASGGLGIMAACADRFEIRERIPDGTEVWMRFDMVD